MNLIAVKSNFSFQKHYEKNTVPMVKMKLKSLLVSPWELPLEVPSVSLEGRTFEVLGNFI